MEIHEEYATQKRNHEASMGVPTPARSVRKLQAERANDYVDELLEKIIECEEEMERMTSAHTEDLCQKDSIIEGLRREIACLNGEKVKDVGEAGAEVEEKVEQKEDSIVTEDAVLATGIDTDGTVKYDTPVTSGEVDVGDEEEEGGGAEEGVKEMEQEKEEEEDDEDEGEESDGSIMDLIEDDKNQEVGNEDDAMTVGAVVAESADTPKADREEEVKLVEPTDTERKRMDDEAQKRKLKRLPRSRCSEVACIPVKKEKVVAPAAEEDASDKKAKETPAPTPEPTKKKKGLFAKLTSGKKKRKAGEDISPSAAGAKRDRKSLGEISNISELTQPTVLGGKLLRMKPRPRGRAPKGKQWDGLQGVWVIKS